MNRDWFSATVGLLTMLTILFLPEIRSRALVWIGTTSYSLYLIHVPLGGRVINLAERLPEIPVIRLTAIGAALALSLLIAALFFQVVEKPSHHFSRQVRQRIAAWQTKPISYNSSTGN